MGRLLVLAPGHPHRVSKPEARAWLEARVAEIATAPGVESIRLQPLASASARRPCGWQWLLEIELDERLHHAADLVDNSPFSDVLLDMRLLGMPPEVAYVPIDQDA